MTDYDLIANLMLIACALGFVIATRYQLARRHYRKPSASAQQAGTRPPAFYCDVPACPNYAPSGSARTLTHRPSHACRHSLKPAARAAGRSGARQ